MILGTMAGIGLGLVSFLLLALVGLVGPDGGEIALIFVQYLALFAGGHVAGRLGRDQAALNGGLAGLAVFAIVALISVPGGASPGVGVLVFLGVVAAVLGSAGGVLALHGLGR